MTKHLRDKERVFEVIVDELAVAAGEICVLNGESGTGKSTVMEMLSFAAKPESCSAFCLETPDYSGDLSHHVCSGDDAILTSLRRAVFGYSTQVPLLVPFLSVLENIELTQKLARRPDPSFAVALAEELGLGPNLRAKPADLSVGQRQRACIARSLAHRPSVVLLDEPTSALDPDLTEKVVAFLLDHAARYKTAFLVISHEANFSQRYGLRAVAAMTSSLGDNHVRSRFAPICGSRS